MQMPHQEAHRLIINYQFLKPTGADNCFPTFLEASRISMTKCWICAHFDILLVFTPHMCCNQFFWQS